MKTAKALGITIPPSVLVRADRLLSDGSWIGRQQFGRVLAVNQAQRAARIILTRIRCYHIISPLPRPYSPNGPKESLVPRP
jgi:hypothetical protein